MKAALFGFLTSLALLTGPGLAEPVGLPEPCQAVSFEQTPFVTCAVDTTRYDIRLFLSGPDGQPYGSLEAFLAQVPAVVFAMNAGMYLPDSSPQGLYVEGGETITPLATGEGNTNFYLKPNGVFTVDADGHASVVETSAFALTSEVAYATQSGPMLVIDGVLHPRFAENGTSLYVRNGVGVRADGTVVFAISLKPVSFGRFGRLFRDAFDCPDALYLDGFVSGLAGDGGMVVGGGHKAGPIVVVMER